MTVAGTQRLEFFLAVYIVEYFLVTLILSGRWPAVTKSLNRVGYAFFGAFGGAVLVSVVSGIRGMSGF